MYEAWVGYKSASFRRGVKKEMLTGNTDDLSYEL